MCLKGLGTGRNAPGALELPATFVTALAVYPVSRIMLSIAGSSESSANFSPLATEKADLATNPQESSHHSRSSDHPTSRHIHIEPGALLARSDSLHIPLP
jgi:hypothetical protein